MTTTKAVLILWFASIAANAVLVPIAENHPLIMEDRR